MELYYSSSIKSEPCLTNAGSYIFTNPWCIVTGGTDTHLFLVDVGSRGLTGQQAEEVLKAVGFDVNRS